MRIGLLADLHANREATEACLETLSREGCEQYVFLGDLVGYGADPGWMIDTVRAHVDDGALAVLGNHDAAVDDPQASRMHAQALAAIDWTRAQLDESQRAFLRELPLQATQDDRLYVHANAWEPAAWGYVHNPLAAHCSLMATDRWLTFCGHVHDPALYYTGAVPGEAAYFQPEYGMPIPLPPSRRWLAIVGSCGQPRDGNPAAACALMDTARKQLTFLRVPYNHARAAQKIRDAGLPAALADRLLTGA